MYTLGLGSFLGDFADRYTPEEVQYGTSEEVNRRQKTENLAVKLLTDILVSRDVYKVEINNGITPNYAIVNGQNFLKFL